MKIKFDLKDRDGRIFSIRSKDYKYWVQFFKGWHGIRFTFQLADYFDNRIGFVISLGYGRLFIDLPIYTKYDECDAPEYGFYYFENSFWIQMGRKIKSIRMPWHYEWVRTSCLRNDGTWEHEGRGDKKDFWKEEWKPILWSQSYPYTYILNSGTIQNRIATLKVEEREWRMRWLMWASLFSKKRRSIHIDFNDEVGEKTRSWKGGCTGCSYEMKDGELPEQTLRRMGKERKF